MSNIVEIKGPNPGSLFAALMVASKAPCTLRGKPNFEKIYGDAEGFTYHVKSKNEFYDVCKNGLGWKVVAA